MEMHIGESSIWPGSDRTRKRIYQVDVDIRLVTSDMKKVIDMKGNPLLLFVNHDVGVALNETKDFFNNWAVIGMYVLFVFFLAKILRRIPDGIYADFRYYIIQILAAAMIVAYFEICLHT